MVAPKQILNKEKFVSEDGSAYWIITFYMEESGEVMTTVVEEGDQALVGAPELPPYIAKLDSNTQAKWYTIYKSTAESEGEDVAILASNLWLQRYLASTPSKNLTRIQFDVDHSQPDLVTRSENGEEYISFKLADTMMDQFGVQLNDTILGKWADKINAGKLFAGADIDHEEYDKLVALGLSPEEISERLVGKNGIAKAVQAVVEKGKLWVRALIDKRYKKIINNAKGVSMEALVTRDDDGTVVDGDLIGWTFAVNHTPAVEGTTINL